MQTKEQLIEILNETNKIFELCVGLLNNLIESKESIEIATKETNLQIKKEVEKQILKLEDVRKVLVAKSREGYTKQIRALLIKYGADKLSEIKPVNYQNLVDEAYCFGATKEMIKEELNNKQEFSNQFKAVYEHHSATSLTDLKEEYYPAFLRDIRGLGHE
ncbi:MAG: hypothetical protein PQJ49_00920 [Sphaerochaetaceae bacterium]|nr:hypothetical protein [Sphaerochaetaceae bacterium]